MRRINFENVKNFRDLGGYQTQDGKMTKFNTIYRSSVPTKLKDNELKFLKNNNLTTIIDLRSNEEIKRKINIFSTMTNEFEYHNIALRGSGFPKREKDIALGYLYIIDDFDNIKKVFDIIKLSKGSILINCNAGKDRTGVICMLLLLLAKVYEDDIIADYQISYTYLKDDIRKMHIDDPKMPKYLGNSKMEYMEEVLKLFKNKYKNIENYMHLIGFSSEDIKIILDKFIGDDNLYE